MKYSTKNLKKAEDLHMMMKGITMTAKAYKRLSGRTDECIPASISQAKEYYEKEIKRLKGRRYYLIRKQKLQQGMKRQERIQKEEKNQGFVCWLINSIYNLI